MTLGAAREGWGAFVACLFALEWVCLAFGAVQLTFGAVLLTCEGCRWQEAPDEEGRERIRARLEQAPPRAAPPRDHSVKRLIKRLVTTL